jgi:hypothetical protein
LEWFRPKGEGSLGQWHIHAGDTSAGLVLAACDRTFRPDEAFEERQIAEIPANERCGDCQGVHAAMKQDRRS